MRRPGPLSGGAVSGGSSIVLPHYRRPLMTKKRNAKNAQSASNSATPTKHQQVIDLLTRDDGASLKELSAVTNWLPHSTRAFLTGLKKKGYTFSSEKAEGVRRYRTISLPTKGHPK